MALENLPPDVVALVNSLRRRIGELERRLAQVSDKGADLTPTDFVCFDVTDIVGSVKVNVTQNVGGGCGSGYLGTGYVPIFATAD